MRVLLTTDTVGGVWTFTRELTEGLLDQGNSVALASFGRPPSPEQRAWASAVETRYRKNFLFRPHNIPLEWMDANERAFPEGDAALSLVIDQFAPDILHASQFCFGASRRQLPCLITAHSDVLSWAAACREHDLEPTPWLDRYRTTVQCGLASADAVVAPTHAMLHALEQNFHLSRRHNVIANGRSLPPATDPAPARTLRAVTAGRLWDEAKNIALLTSIHSPMPLVVAGEQSFQQTENDPELSSLEFAGALTEARLLHLFRSSVIYIVPSLYEPFGLAPLEAALCGCAVLANNLPSLLEVWADGAIYFHDSASLEQQLERLAQYPDLLAAAQQNAHRRALTLSRDAMVTRYLGLYRELLPASQKPGAQSPIRKCQHVA